MSGALNQHADEIFNGLGDVTTREQLQRVAERLFRSLSERRDGGQLMRRPMQVALAALETAASESDIEAVAEVFQVANLLVFSPTGQSPGPKTRLDISHESLLRQWKRLGAWIDSETKFAQQYRRLKDEVENDTRFLTDTHLDQAQEWVQREHPNVYWASRYDGSESTESSPFQVAWI